MLGKYVCWRRICEFAVTSDFFANVKFHSGKKALYLSIDVFCMKVLLGDTVLMGHHFMWSSEPRKGLAICRAKGVPSFLSHFKTLSVGQSPEI